MDAYEKVIKQSAMDLKNKRKLNYIPSSLETFLANADIDTIFNEIKYRFNPPVDVTNYKGKMSQTELELFLMQNKLNSDIIDLLLLHYKKIGGL
jgi:hypothetical protein